MSTVAIIVIAVLSGAAMTGFLQEDASNTVEISTLEIVTASTQNGDQYGLLPKWQQAYNGTGNHDYSFNGSGSDITNECGNCHMSKGSSKHEPPLHPTGLNSTDTGDWFFDDDLHRGPNTQLAQQLSGLTVNSKTPYCGDCHTPTNASGFADPDNSARTSDPHSVHRDVMTREGCIRCHNYDNVTFTGSITFTQNNATRTTYGLANPINMTRVWDGKFLSISTEAKYNSTLGTGTTGWNRYGQAEDTNSSQYACGDCHGQYHKEGGLGFTFDDSADSRKGPLAPVNYTNSIGISSGGNDFTCGNCHTTDAHAVHTNGGIVTALNWTAANSIPQPPNPPLPNHNSSARGAEYCDECHSQNVGVHSTFGVPMKLGLTGFKDNLPDALASESGYGPSDGSADCGFCHN